MNFYIQIYHFYFENFFRLFPNAIEIINSINLIIFIFLLSKLGGLLLKKKEAIIVNFFLGWIIFYYFLFFGNWIFNLDISLLIKIFFGVVTILLIYKKKIFIEIKNFDFKVFLILLPYFFVLLSIKTVEWDSFAFWIYQTDYLINNDNFINKNIGEIFHHATYPQAKNILIVSGTMMTGVYSENLPAIFSFIMIFLVANFFYSKKRKFQYLILFLTFCSPILITDKIFSHYHDFILGISILITVYILIKKNFITSLNNQSYIDIFYYSLICSLTPVIKNVGIIHTFSILFCFFTFSIFKKNFLKKIDVALLKKYFF